MYPSIFNRFPVIQPVSSKVRHFSPFFVHFGLPWVRTRDNLGNVTWIEREFNACQTPRSMYQSSSTISENDMSASSDWFSTVNEVNERFFYHILLSLGIRPWNNRSKCYMDRKRIQCWSNASQHVAYASIINRLRAIARYWSEIATFSYPPEWPLGQSRCHTVGKRIQCL